MKGVYVMTRKRGNNEGTISRRKDGRWCAAITIGYDENNKQKRQFFYGKTRQEVAEKLNKAINDIANGLFVEPNKVTVSEWFDVWLFEYKKPSVRATTYESYEYLNRIHIKPSIGHVYLKDLKPEHLQKFYNDKVYEKGSDKKGKISAKTIKNMHNVIHSALNQAVINNLIIRNVSDAVVLPKYDKKQIRVLTLDEQRKFVNIIENEKHKVAFLMALGTGLRLGEVSALKWQDINFYENTIKVNRTVRRTKIFIDKQTPKSELVYQPPKTDSGNRSVPIPESLINEIKEYKKTQNLQVLKAGPLYTNNDLIFCNEYGIQLDPSSLSKKFSRLIKKAGLNHINFHGLRHTLATRLLEVNEHPKTVQEILGHSDISLTLNTYTHVMPEIKKSAIQKINHLLIQDTTLIKQK
jgi:integrase